MYPKLEEALRQDNLLAVADFVKNGKQKYGFLKSKKVGQFEKAGVFDEYTDAKGVRTNLFEWMALDPSRLTLLQLINSNLEVISGREEIGLEEAKKYLSTYTKSMSKKFSETSRIKLLMSKDFSIIQSVVELLYGLKPESKTAAHLICLLGNGDIISSVTTEVFEEEDFNVFFAKHWNYVIPCIDFGQNSGSVFKYVKAMSESELQSVSRQIYLALKGDQSQLSAIAESARIWVISDEFKKNISDHEVVDIGSGKKYDCRNDISIEGKDDAPDLIIKYIRSEKDIDEVALMYAKDPTGLYDTIKRWSENSEHEVNRDQAQNLQRPPLGGVHSNTPTEHLAGKISADTGTPPSETTLLTESSVKSSKKSKSLLSVKSLVDKEIKDNMKQFYEQHPDGPYNQFSRLLCLAKEMPENYRGALEYASKKHKIDTKQALSRFLEEVSVDEINTEIPINSNQKISVLEYSMLLDGMSIPVLHRAVQLGICHWDKGEQWRYAIKYHNKDTLDEMLRQCAERNIQPDWSSILRNCVKYGEYHAKLISDSGIVSDRLGKNSVSSGVDQKNKYTLLNYILMTLDDLYGTLSDCNNADTKPEQILGITKKISGVWKIYAELMERDKLLFETHEYAANKTRSLLKALWKKDEINSEHRAHLQELYDKLVIFYTEHEISRNHEKFMQKLSAIGNGAFDGQSTAAPTERSHFSAFTDLDGMESDSEFETELTGEASGVEM
jgi:hypothetical protein